MDGTTKKRAGWRYFVTGYDRKIFPISGGPGAKPRTPRRIVRIAEARVERKIRKWEGGLELSFGQTGPKSNRIRKGKNG